MVGEVIQSYLVSLGVEIDQPGFREMQKTLNQTSQAVASAAGGWAKQFATAAGMIGVAVAGVTTASAGLMASAAKQDLAVEKYARSMLVGKDAAMEMKLAVDALGQSVEDIQLTPELMGRYGALVADGRKMKVGGDYAGQMKGLRDLLFEFSRLKQEAAYAMQWVGYYLTKYLAQPLAKAKSAFREINGNLIKSMPVWTEKIARGLAHIVDIGLSFLRLLKNVGSGLYEIWDSFPRGAKLAIASLGALFAFVNASPIGRFTALLGTMLLLVEDYFGYMDGKNAALGPIWDKLNHAMDAAKEKLKAWGELIAPVWEDFTDGLMAAKKELAGFSELLAPVWKEFGKYLISAEGNVKVLGKALYGLGKEALGFASSALEDFQKSLQKHEVAEKFSGVLDRLRRNFEDLTRWTGKCIDAVSEWLRQLRDDEAVRDFLDAVAELCGALLELFAALNDLVTVALSSFFGEMDKTDKVYTFRDAVRSVVELIAEMIRCISKVLESLTDLFKMMSDNKQFVDFWKGLSNAAQGFSDIVAGALDNVGKLGKRMLQLAREKYDKVSKAVGGALFSTAEASGVKFNLDSDEITGELSALGESGSLKGDPGVISPGINDPGGVSYGAYQFSSVWEVPEKFVNWLKDKGHRFGDQLSNAGPVNSEGFKNKWRGIAAENEEEFLQLQREYAVLANYIPALENIKIRTGVDISKMSKTMQEVLFSTAIHQGPGSDIVGDQGGGNGGAARVFERAFNELGPNLNEVDELDLIRKIYQLRLDYFPGIEGVRLRLTERENLYAEERYLAEMEQKARKNEQRNKERNEQLETPIESEEKGIIQKIKEDIVSAGESVVKKIESFGDWFLESIGYNDPKAKAMSLNSLLADADPFHLNGIMQQDAMIYNLDDGTASTTNLVYRIDVGGVVVQNTNASPDDIGEAVAKHSLVALEDRTKNVQLNRSLTGVYA